MRLALRSWLRTASGAWQQYTGAGAPNQTGALLVAPADPHKFGINRDLAVAPLGVSSIVIGSENDPWPTLDRARIWARQWGSALVNEGPLGHIIEMVRHAVEYAREAGTAHASAHEQGFHLGIAELTVLRKASRAIGKQSSSVPVASP